MVSLQEKIRRRRASIKCDVIHNLLLVVHNMNAIVQIILLVNNEKKTDDDLVLSFIHFHYHSTNVLQLKKE